jgi:hypothetical protein
MSGSISQAHGPAQRSARAHLRSDLAIIERVVVRKRCSLVAVFALLCVSLVVAARDAPYTVIPLESYLGTQTAVRFSVAGHEGLFLFDTGEGVSTITPQFATAIGCTPWGQVTGFRMSGERLDFPRCDNVRFDAQGQSFRAPIAGVFDIMSLLPKDVPVLDGAVGLDIFAGRVLTIEPRANRLTIETARSLAARIRTAKEVRARLVRDAEGVALAVDGGVETRRGIAWMELDTGNGGAIVIANHIAPLLGLTPDQKRETPASFMLSGRISVTGNARTRDLIMDGNISNQFLRNWNLTLDLVKGRAWLAPAT